MKNFVKITAVFLASISVCLSSSSLYSSKESVSSANLGEKSTSSHSEEKMKSTTSTNIESQMSTTVGKVMPTASFSISHIDIGTKELKTEVMTKSVAMETKMKNTVTDMMSVKMMSTKSIVPSPSSSMKVTPSLPPDFEKKCLSNCTYACCHDDEIASNYYNETLSCENLSKMQCEHARSLYKCESKVTCSECECSGATTIFASIFLMVSTMLLTFKLN